MVCEKALLVLAGPPPSNELLTWRMEETDCSIAVDGGWNCFVRAGLLPQILIGDADSFLSFEQVAREQSKVSVHQMDDQETTDFEKALDWLDRETLPQEIIILGGLGGRSDHSCTNWMIASRIDAACSVVFDSQEEWVCRITSETPLSLRGNKGATLSLIPMIPCTGVSSQGLRWNLEGESLSVTGKLSQSNLCDSDEVKVSCEEGVLFAVLRKTI
ncbi:MAG: thiamine diphosphokinase [Verrucomicrobia bacterium TMED40]|nr:MAG: thiamine diphosphokinase [Verrucomicrobia bacterium TMED40]